MLCLSNSIDHDDLSVQSELRRVEHAQTLTELRMAAWSLARVVVIHVVEAVLHERARRPTSWPPCPVCGQRLHSKGFAKREVTRLLGVIRWQRRVGRCPQGCAIGQVAPLDDALGLQPSQRSSSELQCLGGALAVFVPYATAARLLGWFSGAGVSAGAVRGWVQAAGPQAMATLQASWHAVANGELPREEPREDALAAMP
jgi:hypothetical protein